MAASYESLIADQEFKLRLVTFLSEAEKHLRCIFHDPKYGNFPTDRKKIYGIMVKLDKNGSLNHLQPNQRTIVLPKSRETDSQEFDITLLSYFLLNHVKLSKKVREAIEGIRKERNLILHNPNILCTEFQTRWTSLEVFLSVLNYDISTVKDLKSGSLEHLEHLQVSINKSKIELQDQRLSAIEHKINTFKPEKTQHAHNAVQARSTPR
ncbi:uncharacterized protein LOC130648556 [Hydractinia symbiolongicarpus]|uniref:uncharacterized protein LOC130648556 n=1 Tax=Hydractinia symbiolongicarpus TaxID=13093 RepID=UPI002550AB42|nr:uncharacterized protein LOC130648556 [Hydractinia symbiolongicarpus]